TPAAGADAQSTLAFLLTGPLSSLFALAPREAPPVLAPARRFRRTRLAERDGNGQTAPLTLPPRPRRPRLSSPCLNLCVTRPAVFLCLGVDLAMRYLTCFSVAEPLGKTSGCTSAVNLPAETLPGCRAFITQSEEEVYNDEPRNCDERALAGHGQLRAWRVALHLTLGPGLQRRRSYRDECLDLWHHHRASRAGGHLRLRQLGGVGCRSHRRLGVHLPMGARCSVKREHPVELANRRSVARDPGALVVLAR